MVFIRRGQKLLDVGRAEIPWTTYLKGLMIGLSGEDLNEYFPEEDIEVVSLHRFNYVRDNGGWREYNPFTREWEYKKYKETKLEKYL